MMAASSPGSGSSGRSNDGRRLEMLQAPVYGDGQNDPIQQDWKEIDMFDQQEIVDWTRVGYNQPHVPKSQSLERRHVSAQILNGEIGPNLVRLEETVERAEI